MWSEGGVYRRQLLTALGGASAVAVGGVSTAKARQDEEDDVLTERSRSFDREFDKPNLDSRRGEIQDSSFVVSEEWGSLDQIGIDLSFVSESPDPNTNAIWVLVYRNNEDLNEWLAAESIYHYAGAVTGEDAKENMQAHETSRGGDEFSFSGEITVYREEADPVTPNDKVHVVFYPPSTYRFRAEGEVTFTNPEEATSRPRQTHQPMPTRSPATPGPTTPTPTPRATPTPTATPTPESAEPNRGFFTNGNDSEFEYLNDPGNLSLIGFGLSIGGIFLQLVKDD